MPSATCHFPFQWSNTWRKSCQVDHSAGPDLSTFTDFWWLWHRLAPGSEREAAWRTPPERRHSPMPAARSGRWTGCQLSAGKKYESDEVIVSSNWNYFHFHSSPPGVSRGLSQRFRFSVIEKNVSSKKSCFFAKKPPCFLTCLNTVTTTY